MAKFLFFNDGNDNALTMPVSRLLGIDQTGNTSIALLFEDKDGTAGSVTTVTLTIAAGKEKQVMENLADAIESPGDIAVIFDSTITDFTGRDVSAVSIDSAGTNSNGLTAGAGITGGTGTVYNSWIEKNGNVVRTSIFLDITGLGGSATPNDVIGITGTDQPCHIGKITTAQNGVIFHMVMTTLEQPSTDMTDIDIHANASGTLTEDDAAAGDVLLNSGGITAGDVDIFASFPTDGQHLYLGKAAGSAAGAATAGKILIEMYGKV